MSAIEGWSPPMNRRPFRKKARYTSIGSASAAVASCCAFAFSSSFASDVPTSPGYPGNDSVAYVARASNGYSVPIR